MRLARAGCALLVNAVIVGNASRVRADDWSLNVLGAAAAGWSDNITSVPDALGPESDYFYQLHPGAVFAYERRRMIHELAYDFQASLYTEHDEANSYSHRVGWRGFFMTSPLSELATSVGFATGQVNTFEARNFQNGAVVALPSGQSDFVQAEASEHYSQQLSQAWRFLETGVVRRFETRDEMETLTTGMEVGGTLGVDRAWRDDALALTTGASYVELDHIIGETTQVNSTGTLLWRHDLGMRWSTSVDAGVTVLLATDGSFDPLLLPTVGTSLTYTPEWGTASANLRRSVTPNLYIAENTISDTAVVGASLPLPWLTPELRVPRLSVGGTLGFNRTRTIDLASGDISQSFDVYVADVTIDYAPLGPGWLAFSLRGSYLRQAGDGAPMELDYDRTTVLFSVHGQFPSRRAAEIPGRAGTRVDRSDSTPVGDEVAPSGGDGGGGNGR